MNVFEVLFIAAGLSLDVFAYVIYKGAMLSSIKKTDVIKLCVYFAIWQAGAVLLGNLVTKIPVIASTQTYMNEAWNVISALIFLGLGVYMLIKSGKKQNIFEHKEDVFNYKQITIWACLTSIDAFASGISLGFLETGVLLMVIEIAITTIISVIVGIILGYRLGCAPKNIAVKVGGALLLLGGIDVIIVHTIL